MRQRRTPVSETRAEPEPRSGSDVAEPRDSRATEVEQRHEDDHRPARGYSWRTFWEGNAVATKHGSYFARIPERALEIAEAVKHSLEAEGLWRDLFVPTVLEYGIVRTRVERASAAIGQADDAVDSPLGSYVGQRAEAVAQLRDDLRKWLALALSYERELGLTGASLARIARDTGQGQAARASAAARALDEHVDREHGPLRAVGDDDG